MRLCVGIVVAVTCVVGCATPRQQITNLPESHTIVRDQLVVHCNFDLPSNHRLLDELVAQRGDLSKKLGLTLSDEPIHVYLFPNTEQFSDFIRSRYPLFPHRRAFFVETDTRLAVYAHWGDRVAEDLRHEVSHGYLHSIIPNLPLWLDEGLAEYFEVPRGHRGLNLPHVDELLAARRAGKWQPDIRRLEAIKSPGDMTQLDYAEAWAWVHLLLETDTDRWLTLSAYLQSLRREGAIEPLSLHLRRLPIDPERTVLEHVIRLDTQRLVLPPTAVGDIVSGAGPVAAAAPNQELPNTAARPVGSPTSTADLRKIEPRSTSVNPSF